MRRKKVSLADIAQEAGVSLMTVSRALHGVFGVSDELQKKIQAIAEEKGYVPSRNLFDLKKRRLTKVVGFVLPQLSNTFFPQLYEAIDRFFTEKGWRVHLCCSYNSTIREYRTLSSLVEMGVDGLLWCPVKSKGYVHFRKTLREVNIPLVFVDRKVRDFEADSVVVNDYETMLALTRHLISQGKRRIAYLGDTGPDSWVARERQAGYVMALHEAHLPIRPELILNVGSDWENGARGTRELLNHEIDAICCYNDPLAIGAEKELLARGYKIPDDIALVGFSDVLATQIATIPITTAHQDAAQIGVEASRLLHNRIISPRGIKGVMNKVIPTELVFRQSTRGTKGTLPDEVLT